MSDPTASPVPPSVAPTVSPAATDASVPPSVAPTVSPAATDASVPPSVAPTVSPAATASPVDPSVAPTIVGVVAALGGCHIGYSDGTITTLGPIEALSYADPAKAPYIAFIESVKEGYIFISENSGEPEIVSLSISMSKP